MTQRNSQPILAVGAPINARGEVQATIRISVIIPVGPGDESWRGLLPSLALLHQSAEVLLVATEAAPPDWSAADELSGKPGDAQWLVSRPGRASQMNLGVAHAAGDFLWFLHADSQVDAAAIAQLYAACADAPNALHYFDLVFQSDGPASTWLNSVGARFRSRVLRLPFGDQGLCLRRELFQRLGPFDEQAEYGEDHLLVWQAHRHGVPIRRVAASIGTSARKYAEQGWLATTALHSWRTWRQAIPQLGDLLWSRRR